MPLIPKKMQKEMKSDKPQGLIMAVSVKRKSKKMANGGPVSAKSEKRPMPEQGDISNKQANMDSPKSLKQDKWADRPERMQSMQGPKMASSSIIKASPVDALGRRLDMIENHLMKLNPSSPKDQPPKADNEMDAMKAGPAPHKMKMMAKGGMINEDVSMNAAEMDNDEHPAGLESDNDEMSPNEDEFMSNRFAGGGNVKTAMQNTADPESLEDVGDSATSNTIQGSPSKDQMDEYNSPSNQAIRAKYGYAEGGEVEDEEMLDHHASVAAAIMARRDRKMMAEGGEVDIDSNNEEQPNSFYHQNEEAALKENYDSDMDDVSQPEDSNLKGDSREDDEENEHDSSLVSKIMRKRKSSPISK